MEPNLLEIVFNEAYYLSKVGTISNAFTHYLDYGIKNCIDPCSEFETHNLNMKATGKPCLYNDWMSSTTLIEKSFYLNIFMEDDSHKQNDPLKLKKVRDYFNKFTNSDLEFTEQFIRSFEKKKIDNIFIMLLNSVNQVSGSKLQEETLSTFEKVMMSLNLPSVNGIMLMKLLDSIKEENYNIDREEFVSSIISKKKFNDDTLNLVLKFYNDMSESGRTFSLTVYQNFENFIENSKDKIGVLEILAHGVK